MKGPGKFAYEERQIEICGLKLHWPFPLASMLGSSSAMLLGCSVFGKDRKVIAALHRKIAAPLRDYYWDLQHRFNPRHQYHVIRTGLRPGYYDVDTLMLNACMALLCRYVEDEQGGVEKLQERFNWLSNPSEHKYGDGTPDEALANPNNPWAQKESAALKIYHWWKVEKPADEKRRNEIVNLLFGNNGLMKMHFTKTNNENLSQLGFTTAEGKDEIAEKLQAEKYALEEKIEKDESEMLKLLVEIRGSLWT